MVEPAIYTTQELDVCRREADLLIETGRRITQAHYQLVTSCADFADGPVWIADGEPSAAHWLAPRLDACASTVRDWIGVGRALRVLHASAAAFQTGELSYSKVRALVSIATPANETELLAIARTTPAADIAKAFARWSQQHEDHTVIDSRHRRSRAMRTRTEPDGTVSISLRLPPLQAGIVERAVEAQVMRRTMQREPDGTWPTLAQQRADALTELVTSNANHRFEVLIHVDHTGCRFPDGTPLTDTTVTGLLDQAAVRLIVHDTNGRPVNASDARRRPTIRQKRTTQTSQPACTQCGTTHLPNLHHTTPHAQTGHTRTDQLQTLCTPCHRKHHKDG